MQKTEVWTWGLPGHIAGFVQTDCCKVSPEQFFPPCSGFWHSLSREVTPLPHVLLHFPQLLHFKKYPSTTNARYIYWNNTKSPAFTSLEEKKLFMHSHDNRVILIGAWKKIIGMILASNVIRVTVHI